jgi:hypothetical protein
MFLSYNGLFGVPPALAKAKSVLGLQPGYGYGRGAVLLPGAICRLAF